MGLYAIQVLGTGSFPLPPFYKPFAYRKPIKWRHYGKSCSCLFQKEIHIFRSNKLEDCNGSCKVMTAFWTTVLAHEMGFEDLQNNLRQSGSEFTMTEIKAFRDECGNMVKWGGSVKTGDQKEYIRKLYRSKYLFPRPGHSNIVLQSIYLALLEMMMATKYYLMQALLLLITLWHSHNSIL